VCHSLVESTYGRSYDRLWGTMNMTRTLEALLEEFDANGPSSDELVDAVEKYFGCTLPPQYKNFMAAHDGGEGFIGTQYLILWRIAELIEFNRDYELAK